MKLFMTVANLGQIISQRLSASKAIRFVDNEDYSNMIIHTTDGKKLKVTIEEVD